RRPELDWTPKCRVAAVRPVRVERLGVDVRPDPAEQTQALLSGLRERRSRLGQLNLPGVLARDRAERRGRALAEAETGARVRAFRHRRSGQPAREVVADVQDV